MHVVITFFPNFAAATKREQALDLADLARQIETTTAAAKDRLPWLKLARFGSRRTEKHSLRWDGNLLTISGIEADYDSEQLSFAEAHDLLASVGLRALLYTSPSFIEDAPRWRILAPFSREYPPDHRDRFMARLNGLFGGVFSRESWTRSQSYYFGSVRNNPSHRVTLIHGFPIDLADHFDLIAIGKPVTNGANGSPDELHDVDPAEITDKRIAGQIEALLDNVRNAPDGQKHYRLRSNGIALGGYLHLTDWSEADAAKALVEALPDSVKDKALAKRTAAWAVGEGVKKRLTLPDRDRFAGRWSA